MTALRLSRVLAIPAEGTANLSIDNQSVDDAFSFAAAEIWLSLSVLQLEPSAGLLLGYSGRYYVAYLIFMLFTHGFLPSHEVSSIADTAKSV
ncbi:hypothetical protein Y032_0084g1743 [Ancylostoma ceylanicum]|uniref:Uncharacterized protein n=1 Tax=Ancylostoma ceylanicum TaxID=53326 RepID=A0A016TQQ2_9BILA|nr:hypothetical protein Y032_0084g1743 [Ancylostoma ceylanicum]